MQHRILTSENFDALSPKAVKLLMQVSAQFRGFNNGDLVVTWSGMRDRGWRSKQTLQEALEELLHFGFLLQTRQGGRHRPSLYALTWESIDECSKKLEVPRTSVAGNDWQRPVPPFVPKRKLRSSHPER